MKYKLRIAIAALLATAAAPVWALQLGQIEVKSALNQPLVAAIPLHPENLAELDGLKVGLASADDFTRAGLQLTPTDRSLRFHVVNDNNGQKLILVTSSQPVSDPYLDFLVQVNTRQGKQLREFVVLLNPVIAAPAPAVQAAPLASAPVATPPPQQAAEMPAPAPTPQSIAQPEPQPRPQPQPQAQNQTQVAPAPPPSRPASTAGGQIPVQRGDTLYRLAKDASQGTGTSINQMMLALKSANPEAFFKNNINDLKAGAILRIPTRDEIDRTGVAEANAEVHRQYEAWRAAKLRRVTVVAGSAAHAAARTAPQPASAAPASDHLELVPPTGAGKGTGSRPGVANGTGTETVAGLQQQLQNEQGTLASLNQSNTDLESRVRSLQDIGGKSDKLLSLKDATIAELQRKLAAVQSGKPVAAVPVSAAAGDAAKVDRPASGAQAVKPAAKAAAAKPRGPGISWFQRPLTWIVAGLIVLALILIGLLGRRRRGRAAPAQAPGPLPDPVDVTPRAGTAAYAASLQARLAEDPGDLGAHLALCRLYHAQSDVERFVAAAEAMHAHVPDSGCMEWHEVAVMGEELAPGDPLFAALADTQAVQSQEDPSGVATLHEPVDAEAAEDQPPEAAAATAPDPDLEPVEEALHAPPVLVDVAAEPQPAPVLDPEADPNFYDDPVDTKLDLARAYLDMGDPDGARAMLDEVLEEGSQMQKSEAKRLLVEASV